MHSGVHPLSFPCGDFVILKTFFPFNLFSFVTSFICRDKDIKEKENAQNCANTYKSNNTFIYTMFHLYDVKSAWYTLWIQILKFLGKLVIQYDIRTCLVRGRMFEPHHRIFIYTIY